MRPKRRVYRRGRLLQLFVWSSLKLHRLLARLHMGVNGRRNRGTNVEASTTSRRISANLVVWKVGDSRLRLLRRRGGGGGGGGGGGMARENMSTGQYSSIRSRPECCLNGSPLQ